MADLLVWMVQQTVLGLLQKPIDPEEKAMDLPLPPPMYPGKVGRP